MLFSDIRNTRFTFFKQTPIEVETELTNLFFDEASESFLNRQLTGALHGHAEVGILLATYCEATNIERLVVEIESMGINSQILVIDDSSPDGTAEIVRSLQHMYPNILLHVRPSKLGLGTAITDGFKIFLSEKTPPNKIIAMDADYSHNPKDIPALLSELQAGDGLVIGSRYCEGGKIIGWPVMRRLISRTANILARSVARLKLNDCTSGFRCYSTEFLRAAIGNLHCTTYEIQIETAKQARLQGFKIKEAPVTFVNRKRGKSKLSAAEISGFFSYILKTLMPK
jgi:dolichol-phosphate mannosyltransferase